MKLTRFESTNPYMNLAAEEWLLSQKDEYMLIWQNDKSVILGRNQNSINEVNLSEAKAWGCPVVRRITGGGCVYHDLGNINVSYIYNVDEEIDRGGLLLDAVIGYLRNKGLDACFSGKNDILIGKQKISGCAQLERGSRGLIHCTLMHDVDVHMLEKLLKVDGEKLMARGITSVRSRVMNLTSLLGDLTTQGMMEELEEYIYSNYCEEKQSDRELDWTRIKRLAKSQYENDSWNFGRDSEIECRKSRRLECGLVEAGVRSDAHQITEIRISGDFVGRGPAGEIEEKLKGCFLSKDAVMERLEDVNLEKYFGKISPEELCELII